MRRGRYSQAETDILAQNTAVLRYATHFILTKRAQKNASFSGIGVYVLAYLHLPLVIVDRRAERADIAQLP